MNDDFNSKLGDILTKLQTYAIRVSRQEFLRDDTDDWMNPTQAEEAVISLIKSEEISSNVKYLHSVMKAKVASNPKITVEEWYGSLYKMPDLRGQEDGGKKI